MSFEEGQHVRFWDGLGALAEQDMIPQVFERSYEVVDSLNSCLTKIDNLLIGYNGSMSVDAAFMLAFRLEFYLLCPALVVLFHYGKDLEAATGFASPEEEYPSHIDRFIKALNRFGRVSPEMELVGEVLHSLWQENKKMAEFSNMDQLTGLLNRRGFLQAALPLAHLAKRNRYQVGVLMVDTDNFKSVNDRHGHQFGDRVLAGVASTIKQATRTSDLVGRFGGEEFLVFLSKVEKEALDQVGEKVRLSVESASYEGLSITVSVGGAMDFVKTNVESALEAMINAADHKMYEAKNSGRNRVIV